MKKRTVLELVFVVVLFIYLPVQAAEEKPYPSRAIEIINPYMPGGASDILGRLLATYLVKQWQVSITVINKPGAGGLIGTREGLMAKPDGYTILTDGHGNSTIMDAFAAQPLPFDWKKRTFLCQPFVEPIFFIVRPDAPWKNLKEVAQFARENPKKLKWGESGIGYAALGQFFAVNKISIKDVNHVNFPGGSGTVAAIAGGHVDFAAQQFSEVVSMIEGKKVRALAVTWTKRLAPLTDVPTVAEQGYPMLDVIGWNAMSGPVGLPEEVVKKWEKTIEQGANDPMYLKMAESVYKVIDFKNSKQVTEYALAEHKKYVELAKFLGIN